MQILKNYIDGELISPVKEQYIDFINPATTAILGKAPRSDEDDLKLALKAAENAFPLWSGLPANERAKFLSTIADLIDEELDELARAESEDNGKPLHVAKSVDIPRASTNMRFYASAIMHFSSESHHEPELFNYTLRQPLGVVGCISPWNLPLYLFTWKIAPALASGNCVIAKPSEITPYTAYLLSKICIKAKLPAGVLNILHGIGPEIGNSIVNTSRIKAISFTGGTSTGRKIAEISAPLFRKVSLELGGKNPALVFKECDLEQTVEQLVSACFSNQGEICLCASRLYIQSDIYDTFKEKFVAKVKALKVGNPLHDENYMGALVSSAHYQKVNDYVQLALSEGGHLLCGQEQIDLSPPNEKGYFMRPHVFEGLSNSSRINQEEIFGPVVTLNRFDSEEEALSLANESEYGLASTVWTSNIQQAHRIASQLNTGIVWINCWMKRDLRTPFGGMKNSGIGREGGLEALRFFTEQKNIGIQL